MTEPAPTRPRAGGQVALAALASAAVLASFFAPALDPDLQFGHRDTGRLHHPVKRWIAGELGRGHLPQWNPYAGLGAPVVAGAVDAPQHPLNALFLVLPFEAAFKAWVLLSFAAAALGAFAWGRALGVGPPAALTAGLGFALSGFLLSASDNLTYLTTLAALPWLFAAATAWFERGGPARLGGVALGAALCAAGGDPQAWGLALLSLPAYGALLGRGGAAAGLARGLAAAGAGALASAPFVLPVLAWLPASAREVGLTAQEAQRWNLHPLRLAELLVPHLVRPLEPAPSSEVFRVYAGDALSPIPWAASVYCGAALLALAGLGAARSRRALALLAGAAVLTWMAMGPYGGWGALASRLPVVGAFRYWEKLAVWPALLAAVAAALGVHALAAGSAPRAFHRGLLASGGFALAAGAVARGAHAALAAALAHGPGTEIAAATLALNVADGLLATGAALLALGIVALGRRRGRVGESGAAWAACAVVTLDLASAGAGAYVLVRRDALDPPAQLASGLPEGGLQRVITPFELTRARFPERPPFEAIWLWGARTLAPPWNVAYRVGNLEPYLGMPPRRLASLLGERAPSARVPLAGLWGVQALVVPREPALAADVGLRPPYVTLASDAELPAFVVALPHRPRAYVAARVEPRDEPGALAFALDPASAPGDLTVVEGAVRARAARGSARVERDEAEHVVVRAEADGPALVVLNDVFAPGWTAAIDGVPAPIQVANYLVRGVWMPAGAHRVEFRYRTPLLREGWLCAGALAAGLALAAALARRGERR